MPRKKQTKDKPVYSLFGRYSDMVNNLLDLYQENKAEMRKHIDFLRELRDTFSFQLKMEGLSYESEEIQELSREIQRKLDKIPEEEVKSHERLYELNKKSFDKVIPFATEINAHIDNLKIQEFEDEEFLLILEKLVKNLPWIEEELEKVRERVAIMKEKSKEALRLHKSYMN